MSEEYETILKLNLAFEKSIADLQEFHNREVQEIRRLYFKALQQVIVLENEKRQWELRKR